MIVVIDACDNVASCYLDVKSVMDILDKDNGSFSPQYGCDCGVPSDHCNGKKGKQVSDLGFMICNIYS